jgi:hypothetical protein
MIEVYGIAAVALLVAGAVVGILTVLAAGIRREEKAARRAWPPGSFTTDSPSRIASGARTANGLYVRMPGAAAQQASKHPPDLALAGPGGPPR